MNMSLSWLLPLLLLLRCALGNAVEPPPPENTILPPRPPTPPSAGGGGGVQLSRGSFRAFFLNNFATDPVPAEDATIAIARAFRVPEDRLPLPNGVLIRDIRATTAGDIAGDANASFIGGTLMDFDSSYPLVFDLPNSVSIVSAWEADIAVPIAQGKVSTFSSNMFFLWPNGWFYAKYGISNLKGVIISGFPPPAPLGPVAPPAPPPVPVILHVTLASDSGNLVITIAWDGVASSLAVGTLLAGTGDRGSADGAPESATFSGPEGIVIDSSNQVWVADGYGEGGCIRKIVIGTSVTTVAGDCLNGGGTPFNGNLAGLAIDVSSNTLFSAGTLNNYCIYSTMLGSVSTSVLAGNCAEPGTVDGPGATARFEDLWGLGRDPANGIIYASEPGLNCIRKITSAGVVTTLAGLCGFAGTADGQGTAARFNEPHSLQVEASGSIIVADKLNHCIRRITASGLVTTLAGTCGSAGPTDGTGADARFILPLGVAIDPRTGMIYLSQQIGCIRIVHPITAVVTTMSGTCLLFSNAFFLVVDT
eukprot:gene29229-12482_t